MRTDIFLHYFPENHVIYTAEKNNLTYTCIAKKESVVKNNTISVFANTIDYINNNNTIKNVTGKIKIVTKNPILEDINPGDTIIAMGKSFLPRTKRNIGEFNYRQYLNNRDIYLILKTNQIIIRRNNKITFLKLLSQTRNSFKHIISKSMSKKINSSIATVSICGHKNELPQYVTNSFTSSGLLHILAVSGFHTGIIISIFLFISSLFIKNRKLIFVTTIIFLWLYAYITGLPTSVERSAWMATIFLISNMLEKNYVSTNSLAVSGIIILLLKPYMIFDVGFLLSFTATFGILIYFRNRLFLFPFLRNKTIFTIIFDTIMVSTTAMIFIIPILSYNFGNFSIWGIIATPIAAVLMGFSIISSILTIITYPISSVISSYYGALNSIIVDLLLFVSNFFSKLPFTNINIPALGKYTLVLYYFVLISIYHIYNLLTKKIILWTCLILFAVSGIAVNLSKNFKIHILDVGNGDAIILQTPKGENILVDAGPCMWKGRPTYESKITNVIRKLGITKLDAVIISHFDSDHYCGLLSVIDSINTKIVFTGLNKDSTKIYYKLVSSIKDNHIHTKKLRFGDKLVCNDRNLTILTVNPVLNYNNKNDNSIVLLIHYFDKSILLTGDIGHKAQYYLGQIVKNIDILKAPHHGAIELGTMEWIANMKPQLVLISNKNRKREQPLLNQNKFKAITTNKLGMITVIIKKDKISYKTCIKPIYTRKNLISFQQLPFFDILLK